MSYGQNDFLIICMNLNFEYMKRFCVLGLFCCIVALTCNAQPEIVRSPNGLLFVKVHCTGKQLSYELSSAMTADDDFGSQIMVPSQIAMTLDDGTVLGKNPKVIRVERYSVSQKVPAQFYRKSTIDEKYNELVLTFKGDYQVEFRVYDNAVAYRFLTNYNKDIVVKDELAEFNFAYEGLNANVPKKDGEYQEPTAFAPLVARDPSPDGNFEVQFGSSFENTYTVSPLKQMDSKHLAFLPFLVAYGYQPTWESNLNVVHQRKVVITEADLHDYPGMYLRHTKGYALKGVFAPCPKRWEQGGHNNLQYVVKERHDYLAKTRGKRTFPWRVLTIADQDKNLADNDIVYLLAEPSKLKDVSWIKPGKVAWDWWNNWNIWGVDFESGINNSTYKYYIDFASKSGIEYVILDEGWAVNKQADLFQVVPEIDLQELVDYGKSKGVGIVLWAGYAAMDKDMERVCSHYAEMGIKGFKVDFMDRDDQLVVDFYDRMAATAAKYHLFVDFHGAYKPTGLNRTYPNVLNFEGVFGLEQCKWIGKDVDMVKYDVTIPFIRMLAGPLDYTQGAMRNASRNNFTPSWDEPMSQGTRCHQLAEYVVFDSPFSMLCDAPTAYMQEPECTEFIASVPTVWDETKVLDGKVGEYIVTAKRKGSVWYVGVLTNWTARSISINLADLGNPTKMTMFVDGPNAKRKGCDYQKIVKNTPDGGRLSVEVAPGGGAVLILQ